MATDQPNSATETNERRYRHLFEQVPICILVCDLSVTPAIIMDVNRRVELVFGYTAGDLIGKPATQLVPDQSRASVQTIVQRAQQGETVTAETINRRRDGTTFPVRVIATLDPTDRGRMLVTLEDITAETQRRSEAQAIEAERLRIAHEIHDGVAQSLGGLRFKSALWSHLAEGAPSGMRAALEELQLVLNDAIADLRRAIFALRPIDLDALGFVPALTQLVTDFGDQNQLVAQLDVTGLSGKLPTTYELLLFRVIQEGLSNIAQHARANFVGVCITQDLAHGTLVKLTDNGRGFDPAQIGSSSHYGLRQMRERVLDHGGTLDIKSTLGKGTELTISLPALPREENHVAD